MGKILILAQSMTTGNTGNNDNPGGNNDPITPNPGGNNDPITPNPGGNNDPITPNTPNHPWAYFNGSTSSAELVTPLALSQDGDYVEFDLAIAEPDNQIKPEGYLDSNWQTFGKFQTARAVMGQRESPESFMLWASEGAPMTELRTGSRNEDKNRPVVTSGGSNLSIPYGRFRHKLAVEGGLLVYYRDGVREGSIGLNSTYPNYNIKNIGDAAYALINDGVKFYCRMYLRNLTIKSGGVVTEFGNLLTTNKLTRANVTSAINPVFS